METAVDKFWSRVDRTGDCWLWTGAKSSTGHGHLYVLGERWGAHRLAYWLTHGETPESRYTVLHHLCHTPSCVNPDHLEPMTRKEHSAEHGLTGWAAIHAAKATCDKGHPFDGHDGHQRYCSRCRREYKTQWARRKADA